MADDIEVTLDELPLLQHVALARLHLKFTGDVHALLLDLLDKLNSKLLQHANDDGAIDPIASNILTNFVAIAWREYFNQYELRFQAARREAAGISLAALGYQHQYFAGLVNEASERRGRRGKRLEEQTGVEPFYKLLLADVLKITSERVYSDGFKLSQRIWNLDQAGLSTIQQVVMETVATGDSAWNAAKRLESALGAGQECPRWTSTRLYKLTKADIAAGDETGLLRAGEDSPCLSKGVAYNALRLARNEIQIAHASMTDALFEKMPWVEAEQINLSPSHPWIGCECEDIVEGGENGDGVYPLGEISLPLHVQCVIPGQAILIKDGDKAIENIRIGDYVLTHQGGYQQVTDTFERHYQGEVVKVTTRSGREILLTPEHPVLVNGEWVVADKLSEGDTLYSPQVP